MARYRENHIRERKEPKPTNHRCWYTKSKRHCPLPGTISPGLGIWYCRRHYQTLNNPLLAEAELLYIEKNYHQIINDEYKDWRRKLV